MRKALGESVSVNQKGSLLGVFFAQGCVNDYESALKSDTGRYADYFNFMLDRGIYLAPSQFEAMFVSAAHSFEDIERTCEAVREYAGRKANE